MNIHIITIGAPKRAPIKAGFDFYVTRLRAYYPTTCTHIKDDKHAHDKMATMINPRAYNILLDEHGKQFTSRAFAKHLTHVVDHGQSSVNFFIGGPDGHLPELRARADMLWSLSPLTFPHELAALILAEALYRTATIQKNHPYHRD